MRVSRMFSVIAVCAAVATLAAAVPPAAGLGRPARLSASPGGAPAASGPASPALPAARPTLVYPHVTLPGGAWAKVYSDGIAEVHRAGGGGAEIQHLPLRGPDGGTSPAGDGAAGLPAKGELIGDLIRGHGAPFAAQQVVVIYRPGVTAAGTIAPPARELRGPLRAAPGYTSAPGLNRLLARLGVDRAQQLFSGVGRGRLLGLHATAEHRLGRSLPDFSAAFVLHVTGASVAAAVARLRADPDVAYAAPNWTVTTTHTPAIAVPASVLHLAEQQSRADATRTGAQAATAVPGNYTLISSAQSLLNRPGADVVPAYAALATHGQLPGQGEIITNVSLGTLDDASAAASASDPCNFFAKNYGPTTEIINSQRYLDWPSMPLIPTFTSNASGVLDPTGESCGDDPTLAEVGLDFSMMAPLPHQLQRAGAGGAGLTDLLGIAPGAGYRLVVPSAAGGAVTAVDAAFLAAATQNPPGTTC